MEVVKVLIDKWKNATVGLKGVGEGIHIMFSLANCFFGYRLMKLWIAVAGFVIGAVIGFVIGEYFVLGTVIATIIAIILGVVVAYLAFRIYKAGIFILSVFLSFSFLYALCTSYWDLGERNWIFIIAAILVGLVVGFLAIRSTRLVIILTTGISGAHGFVNGITALLKINTWYITIIATVVLAIAGILWQFHDTKGSR